jgi:hypothetical protein
MANVQSGGGYVNTADIAPDVRRFIHRHGEAVAIQHFKLSRIALVRASAGFAVQRGTRLMLEDGLRRAKAVDGPEDVR